MLYDKTSTSLTRNNIESANKNSKTKTGSSKFTVQDANHSKCAHGNNTCQCSEMSSMQELIEYAYICK
jgi:hypothetical protein